MIAALDGTEAVTPIAVSIVASVVGVAEQCEAAARRGRAEGLVAGLVVGCLGGGGTALGAVHPPLAATACAIA